MSQINKISKTNQLLGFIVACLVFGTLIFLIGASEDNEWFSKKPEWIKELVQMMEDECVLENKFIIENLSKEDQIILSACMGKKAKELRNKNKTK